jgi:hypothetical protein
MNNNFEYWLLDEFENDWEGNDLFSDECVDFLMKKLNTDKLSASLVVSLAKHLYATGRETYDLSAVIRAATELFSDDETVTQRIAGSSV